MSCNITPPSELLAELVFAHLDLPGFTSTPLVCVSQRFNIVLDFTFSPQCSITHNLTYTSFHSCCSMTYCSVLVLQSHGTTHSAICIVTCTPSCALLVLPLTVRLRKRHKTKFPNRRSDATFKSWRNTCIVSCCGHPEGWIPRAESQTNSSTI